jgi:hypothetical protein
VLGRCPPRLAFYDVTWFAVYVTTHSVAQTIKRPLKDDQENMNCMWKEGVVA